jgi:hypothetical protein
MGFLDEWNRRAIERRAGKVEFLGEQSGLVEESLKRDLIFEFATRPAIQRAYLARVAFPPADMPSVALCIVSTQAENGALISRIGDIVRRRFAKDDALDVVFLSAEQELDLQRACRPFYSNPA